MSVNLKDLVDQAKKAVKDAAKKEMKEVELKVIVNGITSRRNIKKVSEDNKIPMNDVFVRINFSIEGKTDVTYTASQRLSSLGKLYLELEQEVNKPEADKKVYSVVVKQYVDLVKEDGPVEDEEDYETREDSGAFITFLPEVSEDEFLKALKPTTNKEKGNLSGLFK